MTKEQKTLDEAIDSLEIILAKTNADYWQDNGAKRSFMDGIKMSIDKLKRLKDGKRVLQPK